MILVAGGTARVGPRAAAKLWERHLRPTPRPSAEPPAQGLHKGEEKDMTFTDAEIDYLASQRLGRLATVQPDGSPQVKPVGFHYNAGMGTIDVTGFNMAASQKFRNVRRNGRAALVVDDIASADPWRVRFLEIRGTADAIPGAGGSASFSDEALIRIHPSRILSFGIEEPPREPHLTRLRTRDLR
jgi:pyridoxamine 5'-phosphate oxidase family protein